MAKKTKKTATPRSPDRSLARARSRAQRFKDRLDYLDEWIDRGASCNPYRMPYRRDLCEAEYKRRLKQVGKEEAPTLEHFARHGWVVDERYSLEEDIRLAARRVVLLDGYQPSDRAPLDELLRRCFGRSDHPSPEDWHDKPDLEILRAVVVALRKLLDADGLVGAVVAADRKPSPLEAAILEVLLEARGSLSGEDLAPKVQRKISRPTTAKAVRAAIGKLRRDCGFPGLRASDAGFKLTPGERALATKLLDR
jgi:hypothetical protein